MSSEAEEQAFDYVGIALGRSVEGDALAEAQRLLASREIDRLTHHIERSLSRREIIREAGIFHII